jgi:ribosomal protein L9
LEKLDEKGFKLDKKHLVKFVPIKELGQTEVTCQLHKDVTAKFKVEVVSENPIEEVAE